MTFPLIAPVITTVLGTGAVAALTVALWPRLLDLARDQLLPWMAVHAPQLVDDVRRVLVTFDGLAVPARRALRSAWRRTRAVLVHEVADLVQTTDGAWVVRLTARLRSLETTGEPFVRLVTEQPVSLDDLPAHVRAASLSAPGGVSIDLTALLDLAMTEGARS